MEGFDFAFTLFGLVLGLAMAEVLAGFVRVLKARTAAPGVTKSIRIGWLTPALSVVLICDLVSTWLLAWLSRDAISVTFVNLIGGTAAAAIYYIAASLVWPDDPSLWPDLDDWFDRHKAQIAGAILASNVAYSTIGLLIKSDEFPPLEQLLYGLFTIALIFTQRRWQSGLAIAGMLSLIALYSVGVIF